jgi:hypothetical protein
MATERRGKREPRLIVYRGLTSPIDPGRGRARGVGRANTASKAAVGRVTRVDSRVVTRPDRCWVRTVDSALDRKN